MYNFEVEVIQSVFTKFRIIDSQNDMIFWSTH